jgi:hypothetical protein
LCARRHGKSFSTLERDVVDTRDAVDMERDKQKKRANDERGKRGGRV